MTTELVLLGTPGAPMPALQAHVDVRGAALLAVLGETLSLALFDLADDVAVAAIRIVRHPPYVDCRKAADGANVNDRRVRRADILAPLAEVTEDSDSADVDVDAFWYVDIDVPEGQQDGHRRARLVDCGRAQVEVQVPEGGGGQRPPA